MSAHPQTPSKAERLKAFLVGEARAAGFDIARIVAPDAIGDFAPSGLDAYLEAGRHGTMTWMEETRDRRCDPRVLWPHTRSILMLGMNYGPDRDPLEVLARRDRAAISVYAQNRDYHDLIKGRLKGIAGRFAARAGADVKVFVDTAPVMEKPLAEKAGVGWQGKHSNLVSRDFGSWLFLGSIFTTKVLPPDPPESDHCGSCRACLDICPTDAFPAPYQLDARRCISYLTIEHKGPIPHEFRAAMGNRIFGCDDCLAVCPWNKFASDAREAKLRARDDLKAPRLADLAGLDDAAFRALFSGSPVKRIGRNRFIRNVLIACGNSADPSLADICRRNLDDDSPEVRGAAVWALSRLLGPDALASLRARAADESDDTVRDEWHRALAM
ncbi:tRNA epoxyqueuosine(34) reductase QueG [Nitratireductor sp. XY-223]|uniref:tRNA epoxyqueuosine(34) reductase QueG n=1 Tax=Nitratireductor sp. XY-223 TaxID=2561926 RepID=UPI0010A9CAA7|nr:tRNA epoxyqueuosine(34) reductase QueG [Nitratireductor sp. XY-223]